MQKVQKFVYWACVTSEISHIFCCGLPTIFSLLSLMSGLGLIVTMPAGLDVLHHALHDYEIPMIMATGAIILLGWVLHYIAYRMDCLSTGCVHEPCAPKKKRSGKMLVVATLLFFANISVYFLFHYHS